MTIDPKLVEELLADYKKPEDIIGENGLLKQLTKAILERALKAELADHVGFEKHDPAGHHSGNSRNGTTLRQRGVPWAKGRLAHRNAQSCGSKTEHPGSAAIGDAAVNYF